MPEERHHQVFPANGTAQQEIMDRVQKKCFIASAGIHTLLVVILFVGPAFLSSKSKIEDMAILDFVPVRNVDALVSGGGKARSLRNDLSSATTIDTNYGPRGGGEAYANYAQVVKSIYERAWVAPDDTANDDAITKVTVTIANNGTVISARILRASGDSS